MHFASPDDFNHRRVTPHDFLRIRRNAQFSGQTWFEITQHLQQHDAFRAQNRLGLRRGRGRGR